MNNEKAENELAKYGDIEIVSGQKVVILHPLADQSELLLSLGMHVEECVFCDFYWARLDLLIFVSMESNATSPSVHFHLMNDRNRPASFHIRTKKAVLSRSCIDSALKFLNRWLDNNYITKEKKGTISEIDICP